MTQPKPADKESKDYSTLPAVTLEVAVFSSITQSLFDQPLLQLPPHFMFFFINAFCIL